MKYQFTIDEMKVLEDCKWFTDREKEVFNLYYIRGWQIEDIAAEYDVNRSSVSRWLNTIRKKAIKIL